MTKRPNLKILAMCRDRWLTRPFGSGCEFNMAHWYVAFDGVIEIACIGGWCAYHMNLPYEGTEGGLLEALGVNPGSAEEDALKALFNAEPEIWPELPEVDKRGDFLELCTRDQGRLAINALFEKLDYDSDGSPKATETSHE